MESWSIWIGDPEQFGIPGAAAEDEFSKHRAASRPVQTGAPTMLCGIGRSMKLDRLLATLNSQRPLPRRRHRRWGSGLAAAEQMIVHRRARLLE